MARIAGPQPPGGACGLRGPLGGAGRRRAPSARADPGSQQSTPAARSGQGAPWRPAFAENLSRVLGGPGKVSPFRKSAGHIQAPEGGLPTPLRCRWVSSPAGDRQGSSQGEERKAPAPPGAFLFLGGLDSPIRPGLRVGNRRRGDRFSAARHRARSGRPPGRPLAQASGALPGGDARGPKVLHSSDIRRRRGGLGSTLWKPPVGGGPRERPTSREAWVATTFRGPVTG